MRKQLIPGWAVIFAATILLAACATHDAQMAHYYKMAGADAAVVKVETPIQKFTEDSATFVSSDWLDVRESLVENREFELDRRENSLLITQAWLDERESQLDLKGVALEREGNALAINQAWLEERENRLAQREDMIFSAEQLADFGDVPMNAKPGRCYAQVLVPGEFLTVTDKVLRKASGTKVEVIPARYETVSEQVLVEKGSLQLKVIPAEYEYVTERVMVEPARKRLVQVPAQYELINEQVMVTPATTTWKKGMNPLQKVDEATGEILCLTEVPAQFQTVSKSVLKTPATTREVEEPAVYKTIQRRVMKTPAKTEMVDVPSKYKTVQVTRLVEPAREKHLPIPAQYQTVTKKVRVSEDRMDWQEIVCETNLSPDKVTNIQLALDWFGFSPGPIDGVIGEQTMSAVNAFQKDHGLTVAKYLTMDTVRALGVVQ